MTPHLLERDTEFNWSAPLPWQAAALETDLSLDTLFAAMAQDDPVILDTVRKVVLAAQYSNRDMILFRQDVLRDCLRHETMVRQLYDIATQAEEKHKKHYLGTLVRHPHWLLEDAVEQMEMFAALLSSLRGIADQHVTHVLSTGFREFFEAVRRDLNDAFFETLGQHLDRLRKRNGTLLGAGLTKFGKPGAYVLHQTTDVSLGFWQRLWARFFPPKPESNRFFIHPRDEAGARALERIRDEGIAFVSEALAQARDHVRDFFGTLRLELAFYLGCVNLHRRLPEKGGPVCFPVPLSTETGLAFQDLYDPSLALAVPQKLVGNTADAGSRSLLLMTGANQGGKSTLLRSIGLAQLMMQAGMFVAAEAFSATVCQGLFTHYKREESAALKSGKFDEELSRMSEIVDHLSPGSMVLLNESFSATNDREGSEIGFQILSGLLDCGVRVVCVTHLYELAHRLFVERGRSGLFLRAERLPDGTRSFRLLEGEPLPSSFGADLYDQIFAIETATAGTPFLEATFASPTSITERR